VSITLVDAELDCVEVKCQYLSPSTAELCLWKHFMFQLIVYLVRDYVLVHYDSMLTWNLFFSPFE